MANKITELLESKGLYDPIDLGDEASLLELLCWRPISIDLYCPTCHDFSVFTRDTPDYINSARPNQVSHINNTKYVFKCSRDNNTIIIFYILVNGSKIMKIGQFPSFMDVSLIISNKYNALLGNYFSEYKSALILYSHGFTIGAYAHLRRIIEHLISDAANQAVKNSEITQKELDNMHVSDRIAALKNHLPTFFVDNVPLYGIISKGIHELQENECREFFPVLQTAIEITLDEEIERRNKAAKAKQAQGAIGKIAGLLGSKETL